jgi:peptidoglycan hydrolase-like protein with peptidoglycan-binding domain
MGRATYEKFGQPLENLRIATTLDVEDPTAGPNTPLVDCPGNFFRSIVNNPRPPSAPMRQHHSVQRAALPRWAPLLAGASVVAVIGFAVFADKGGAGGNPGQVDGHLTVPVSTGEQVVVNTDPTPKTQLTRTLKLGMQGDDVKTAQVRLKAMKFDPGPIDGVFGPGTQQAIWAFEGLVLKRPYDQQIGKLTNDLWQVMQDPIQFGPRRSANIVGTATHMEIYLDLQAAIVFTNDQPTLITHISSGSGQTWCDVINLDTDDKGLPIDPPVQKDVCGVSKTPGGVFQFYRRYAGNRNGPLGGMFNPVYFNFGIAVHGAHNVPSTPASHGCIRIPEFIANYFPTLVAKGDRVYVWDGVKEPEQQVGRDTLPVFNYPNPNPSSTSTTSTIAAATTVPPHPATTVKTKPTTPPTPAPTAPPVTTAAETTTTAGG